MRDDRTMSASEAVRGWKANYPPEDYRGKRMDGYVYVVQSIHGGAVKVGYSDDPVKRLGGLQTGHPQELRIIGLCRGNSATERDIHKALKRHHARGEWFDGTPECHKELSSCGIYWLEPEAKERA